MEQLPYKERLNRLAICNLERRLRLRLGVIRTVNKMNAELFSPNPTILHGGRGDGGGGMIIKQKKQKTKKPIKY